MHEIITARTEGIDALLDAYPNVKLLVDTGYQGLARDAGLVSDKSAGLTW